MSNGTIRIDAQRLEAMLRERQMTLTTLAEKMQMHSSGVLRIKNTGGTNLGTLAAMCNALDCHPFDLLVAEGYPQPFSHAPVSL